MFRMVRNCRVDCLNNSPVSRYAGLGFASAHRLETKFQEVAAAKGEAARARSALEGWQNAFRDECKGMEPEPGAVLDALLTLRAAERKAGEAQRDAKKREAALLFRVQAKEAEMLELKVCEFNTLSCPALGVCGGGWEREREPSGEGAQGKGVQGWCVNASRNCHKHQELCHRLLLPWREKCGFAPPVAQIMAWPNLYHLG